MAYARFQRCSRNPRLAMIDFPGMKIEHAGLPVFRAHALEAVPEEAIGNKAEIPATARRPVAAEPAQCGDRYFDKPAVCKWIEGEARLFGNPIEIVMNGERARAVFVAGFVQDIQGPKVAAG